ncbi:ABC transporter substrate-binding protein [Spirochaetia bacterium]|nr:ABC transporter substrate-binding protein [Spirochaetia bacterium]
MMKKCKMMLRPVFLPVTILSLLTALTLLACGDGKKASGSSGAVASIDADLVFPPAEKQTLTMLTQSSVLAPEDPNSKLIWKRYEALTNVHVSWINYTSDIFYEKRNLLMATNSLPDAIFDAGLSNYDILTYAKNGSIVPVEELVNRYMPRLKAIYDKYPVYRAGVTAPDGHIYTFPWIEELGAGKDSIHSIAAIPWINTAWLKNLGLSMPATIDEFTAVLRAFKNQDANRNGSVSDEIPLSYIFNDGGNTVNTLLGSFGYGDNGDHYIVDNNGKVLFTMADNGYKEGIKWLNQLYREGLIDIEVFTQDWNTYAAKGKAQKYGVFFTWDMGNVSGFVSGDYSDPDHIVSDYAPMPMLRGPDGLKNLARSNGRGYDRGRMAITADNKNPVLTAKWIDGLYDPIQSPQNNWGTYGDTTQANIFELDGSMLKHLPLNGVSPVELRQKTNVGGPLAILDENYNKSVTIPDDAAWRMNIVSTVYVPDMYADNIYPPAFWSQADIAELVDIETPLRDYAMSKQAEWIQSGNIDAQWDSYLAELNRLKLPRYLEVLQKYYDAAR